MSPAPVLSPGLSPQAAAREQQRIGDLCGAVIRALSDRPNVRFRGRLLHDGTAGLRFRAPHLHPSFAEDDFGSFRGAADAMALHLRHSDPAVHARLRPADDQLTELVFETLEQFRVESLADPGLPGMVANLRHRHTTWVEAFLASELLHSERGMLILTIALICRARVTAEPLPAETEDLIEATRFAIVPVIGSDLAGLRAHRRDQAAYGLHAVRIARTISERLPPSTQDEEAGEEDDALRPDGGFNLLVGFEDGDGDPVHTASSGRSAALENASDGYRVFTTAYDQVQAAQAEVRREELLELRRQLDRRVEGMGVNIPRLARALSLVLGRPTADGWDGGREEGRIDGRRLAGLVTSPRDHRIFQTEHSVPAPAVSVTFLLDCSGSMKEHSARVGGLVDVYTRALGLAGVPCEVLGFTTRSWGGGRARRDWQRAGRPPRPGRLNETRHLIFKDTTQSWRQSKLGLAALLKADLYREGVDGEALQWAAARTLAAEHERRLLVVISDGSPMDSATNLANDRHYLEHHLRQVVEHLDGTDAVNVLGVGVGQDLSPYYGRSRVLDLAAPPRQAVHELLALMARG